MWKKKWNLMKNKEVAMKKEKPVIEYVEKPVVKKVVRAKYVRNPIEFLIVGAVCFLLGLLVGWLL
mgnify:CR=1 FL=1